MKRVYCLYRVSTVGQVDHNDIPLQRIACREYAERNGWTIIREFYERGVSGYKVSTDDRDAIQELKEEALRQRFDILLVFMFDRLGRRDDETPFVVEWFVKHDIEVWSVNEGQQKFETHVDKLTNYIRYWQASGESEKTSLRIKARQKQMMDEGHYRGGFIPYGYRLEYLGRTNKKNQPVRDLVIDPSAAENVRVIFDLICRQGYGVNMVAAYLNEKQIPPHKEGALWHAGSIRTIIRNPIYIGIMRNHDELSENRFEQYRIVSDEQFAEADKIISERAPSLSDNRNRPIRMNNDYLLTGLLRCGSCHGHLCGGTSVYHKGNRTYNYRCYRCYTSSFHRGMCDGQKSYSADRIDTLVENEIKTALSRILQAPASQLLQGISDRSDHEKSVAIENLRKQVECIREEIEHLEHCLIEAVMQNNETLIDTLNDAITLKRKEFIETEKLYRDTTDEIVRQDEEKEAFILQVRNVRSWAANYALMNTDEKRIILPQLIEQIVVSKGYSVNIQFKAILASVDRIDKKE